MSLTCIHYIRECSFVNQDNRIVLFFNVQFGRVYKKLLKFDWKLWFISFSHWNFRKHWSMRSSVEPLKWTRVCRGWHTARPGSDSSAHKSQRKGLLKNTSAKIPVLISHLLAPDTASVSDPSVLAGALDDLYSIDPSIMVWNLLPPAAGSAQPPSARRAHGFTSAGSKLYVHGGVDSSDTGEHRLCWKNFMDGCGSIGKPLPRNNEVSILHSSCGQRMGSLVHAARSRHE